jgi:hypothetical protein
MATDQTIFLKSPQPHVTLSRHARTWFGHPRLAGRIKKGVDPRAKRGDDG